jgi:hypothetical protein
MGQIGLALREGVGQLAAGVDGAEEDIAECVGAVGAGVPGFKDGGGASTQGMVTGLPVSSTTMVCGLAAATCGDEIVLVVRERKAGQVHAFALPLIGEDDGHVGALGRRGRCGRISRRSRT